MKKEPHILIVEDEIIIAKDIQGILLKDGYENISIASNYEQAMFQLKNDLPDLIICDIFLKGTKTGIDFVNEICQKINIPVIYISAYSDEDTLKKAFKTNPVLYITKPFTEPQVLTAVKFSLNGSSINSEFNTDIITRTEKDIIKLLASGMTTRQIAEYKNRSYETINNHKRNIFNKLSLNKLTELVKFAGENGLN